MVKKLTKQKARLIYEFVLALDLVPKNLVTLEVLDLIHRSWERERVLNPPNPAQKVITAAYLRHLNNRHNRQRKRQKVLDNMSPINIEPLFDNL